MRKSVGHSRAGYGRNRGIAKGGNITTVLKKCRKTEETGCNM
jgi:hypothetical protein